MSYFTTDVMWRYVIWLHVLVYASPVLSHKSHTYVRHWPQTQKKRTGDFFCSIFGGVVKCMVSKSSPTLQPSQKYYFVYLGVCWWHPRNYFHRLKSTPSIYVLYVRVCLSSQRRGPDPSASAAAAFSWSEGRGCRSRVHTTRDRTRQASDEGQGKVRHSALGENSLS